MSESADRSHPRRQCQTPCGAGSRHRSHNRGQGVCFALCKINRTGFPRNCAHEHGFHSRDKKSIGVCTPPDGQLPATSEDNDSAEPGGRGLILHLESRPSGLFYLLTTMLHRCPAVASRLSLYGDRRDSIPGIARRCKMQPLRCPAVAQVCDEISGRRACFLLHSAKTIAQDAPGRRHTRTVCTSPQNVNCVLYASGPRPVSGVLFAAVISARRLHRGKPYAKCLSSRRDHSQPHLLQWLLACQSRRVFEY